MHVTDKDLASRSQERTGQPAEIRKGMLNLECGLLGGIDKDDIPAHHPPNHLLEQGVMRTTQNHDANGLRTTASVISIHKGDRMIADIILHRIKPPGDRFVNVPQKPFGLETILSK